MGKARVEKQLFTVTKDEVGMFADVTSAIANAEINLKAICAWGMEGKAYFALLTNNNAKASQALVAKGFKVEEREVVVVELDDKIGAAAALAKKIKPSGINLEYAYGSNCGCKNTSALLVLVSKESEKLAAAINV
jgi:hypothetical protein